jgi:hypothetical protein
MTFESIVPILYSADTTFTISWLGAFILISSKLFSGKPMAKMDGILMFPVMIMGPCAASIILTFIAECKRKHQRPPKAFSSMTNTRPDHITPSLKNKIHLN